MNERSPRGFGRMIVNDLSLLSGAAVTAAVAVAAAEVQGSL